jgi:hypothetical protein
MTVHLFSSVHGVSRRQLRGSVSTSRLAGDGAVELSGRREVLERTAGLLADAALALAAGTTDQGGRYNSPTPRPFLPFGDDRQARATRNPRASPSNQVNSAARVGSASTARR